MPDKPITVLTYAASASLAAVALVYLFNPNYLIDGDSSSSASSRKKGVVGLFNPANDCFINCVLQSLAGLGDLRLYLIREVHRRELGPRAVYEAVPEQDAQGKPLNGERLRSLQGGEVTQGLKGIMDRLNERPIYKKTISAGSFVQVLERAFKTRISKSQQDAQELLQIVAERLSEEYQAGKQARRRARTISKGLGPGMTQEDAQAQRQDHTTVNEDPRNGSDGRDRANALLEEEEDGFPLEGQIEAKTECQFCNFIPKVKPTSFVMLTLTVPQKSSSTLNECFDAQFKTEYIDDYKCDKCRLGHAVEVREKELVTMESKEQKALIRNDIEKLRKAIINDPEKVPDGVDLPDSKLAPKRKIGRYAEITKFPKILIIHLSRSIFDPRHSSTKNLSKVSFPERFPVGGLLNRRNYKLLGMVSHKGTHNNGHYETFRRQHVYAPLSNPHLDQSLGPYSLSRTPSSTTIQQQPPASAQTQTAIPTMTPTKDSFTSIQSSSPSPRSSSKTLPSTRPSSGAPEDDHQAGTYSPKPPMSPTSLSSSTSTPTSTPTRMRHNPPRTSIPTFATTINTNKEGGRASSSEVSSSGFKRKKRPVIDHRWWRISDDKIKECKTGDVLAMQKEVYLLFYEMEKEQQP